MACAFVPHADFTLNSGKPNDGYYLDSGVHLSKRASERLIADLQLEKAATQKRNVNSSSRVPCENCGESNHNKHKCRLICEICGEEGHKSKIHGIQNRANENKYQNRQRAYESRRTDRQQEPPRYNTYKRPRKYGDRHDNQWSTGGDRYSNTPRSEGYNRPHKYEDRRSDTPRDDEDDYTHVYGARPNVRNDRSSDSSRDDAYLHPRVYGDSRNGRNEGQADTSNGDVYEHPSSYVNRCNDSQLEPLRDDDYQRQPAGAPP